MVARQFADFFVLIDFFERLKIPHARGCNVNWCFQLFTKKLANYGYMAMSQT